MALRDEFPSLPRSHISLSFLEELPEYATIKPYYFSGPLPEDQEQFRTNICYRTLDHIPIVNLRGQEQRLNVEKHGFQIVKVPAAVLGLDVKGAGRGEYMEEMAEVVKQRLKATFVLCYNYKFRSSSPGRVLNHQGPGGVPEQPDAPAEAAHIDHTPESAIRRARRHLTEEEGNIYLDQGWRLRIVNAWIPLNVVHECDLLYGDFTTVAPTDLHAVDRASSEYVGEVYMLKPRSHYHWYWVDHQRPDEASIFISYDSHPALGAPYCPHASKPKLSSSSSPVSPRESIELRFVVFSPLK